MLHSRFWKPVCEEMVGQRQWMAVRMAADTMRDGLMWWKLN